MDFSVIGKRLPRVDSVPKVNGEAQFSADIKLPGMLFGKILRSPYPHAKILNIDTSKAKRLPGVRDIITGKDTYGIKYGIFPFIPQTVDRYPIAMDKVRFIGEDVAAVAATSLDIAEEALSLIEVEYEELPAVFDPKEAMAPDAPQLHAEVKGNISWGLHMNFGDLEDAFARSDLIREDRFSTQHQNHAAIEPHAALALYNPDDSLTLWASKQDFFFCRRDLADTMKIPEGKVRIICDYMGGGFGGKVELLSLDFCASLLSKRTSKPVRIIYEREEVFTSTLYRHPMTIELRIGVKKDGTILARSCKLIADGGAYVSTAPIAIYIAGAFWIAPYRSQAVKYEGIRVYTNKTPSGPMRGHGSLQPRFAEESQLDMIAQDLRLDPLELRLKNATQPGDITINQFHISSCGLSQCIENSSRVIGWREKKGKTSKENVGVGMGVASFLCGADVSPEHNYSPIIRINYDGTIALITGVVEIGQGAKTVLTQIAAEELGVRLGDIEILAGDTLIGTEPSSYSSRVTVVHGNAVKQAAREAKNILLKIAQEILEANLEDIEVKDRLFYVKGAKEKGIPFMAVIAKAYQKGITPIISRGSFKIGIGFPDVFTGKGDYSLTYSFGATAAEVKVDPETGKIDVQTMAPSHDCGFAINPMMVESQLEGSAAGGLGYGIMEEILWDSGQILNPSLLNYRIPTAIDMPKVKTIIVETIDPKGPFGAKEAGEGIQISPAPAIANAISDALGSRIFSLPITPEKVMKALEQKGL